MSDPKPQPGQWVHILAKVLDGPTAPENVAVELFSKSDQYIALIRRDRITEIVPAPIPPEPEDEAIVTVDGVAYQRLTNHWYRAGRPTPHTWLDIVRLGEVVQIAEPSRSPSTESETPQP